MLPLSQSKEIQKNQFIQFSDSNQDIDDLDLVEKEKKLDLDFNLNIDNQSEIQLIFDEEVGDLIQGYGQGDLLLKIQEELAVEKDINLRLFAEFDNYRKRTAKERIDLFSTANKDIMTILLPIIDNFERSIKASSNE